MVLVGEYTIKELKWKGDLEIRLTIDNKEAIMHNGNPSSPVAKTSVIHGTNEYFKEKHDPENYPFEVLWMKELDKFLIETFDRQLTIYKIVYENLDGGGWGTSAKLLDSTEANFNSLLTLLNYDNKYAPSWAIRNLEKSFPDRMNDEVIPYLPQIVLSNSHRYTELAIIEVMSKYIRNQKYIIIPTLIEMLANNDEWKRKKANDALMKVSSRNYGYDTLKWNNWWQRHYSNIRTDN